MEITRCKPAGKPEGWYDATGTRYYQLDELQSFDGSISVGDAIRDVMGLFPWADKLALFTLAEALTNGCQPAE